MDDELALTADSFWERAVAWWHVSMVMVLAGTAVVTVFDDLGDRYWLFLAGLALIGTLYALIGRRELVGGAERWGWAYLIPAWLIFLGLSYLTDSAQLLLFALFPQTWGMVRKSGASITSTFAMMSFAVVRVIAGDHVGGSIGNAAVDLALSLVLGYWVNGIAEESERRRLLTLELQRTRDELAVVERGAGVLAERERISQEIHDTLAQGFTSLLTLAQAAEADLSARPEKVAERLQLMQRTARQNLAEARALVAGLEPADLAGQELVVALRRVCDRFGDEHPVAVSLSIEGDVRALTRNADVVLLRATQEALTNVGKHAAASKAAVTLDYGAGAVVLTVSDDGCGLSPDSAEGFGLTGMRSRAADVGGALDVRSDAGTTLRLVVP